MGFKRVLSNRRGSSDYHMTNELNLMLDNDYDFYKREQYLKGNYKKKLNKGRFNFDLAQKGVRNLLVVPYSRKYQREYGVKVPKDVRESVSRSRTRNIFRELLE